ncbi:MAG: hypothetical protein LBU90_08280 [Bacteroidales bacterium]|jgi:YbbR domain-containing protein|nr:hypothetical protein [Bacteroidales bacterium]
MKSGLKHKTKQWFSAENRRAIALYLCFVVVATMLWFVKVLDKKYLYTLSVPAQYENKPIDKALLYHLPKEIDVSVNTDGLTLCKYLLFDHDKCLHFDLSHFSQQERSTLEMEHYALLDSLLNDMTILGTQPARIVFAFQKISSKRVKIASALDLQFARQFQLATPIVLKPDSVTIYGAKQMIDTIREVFTVAKTIANLSGKSTYTVALQGLDDIRFSDSLVQVLIEAEKFTEKKYSVPITFINVPANVVVDLMQNNVILTVFIGLSKVEKISEHDFKAVADYRKRNTTTGEIPVEIIAQPPHGSIIQQNPHNVEIIFEEI